MIKFSSFFSLKALLTVLGGSLSITHAMENSSLTSHFPLSSSKKEEQQKPSRNKGQESQITPSSSPTEKGLDSEEEKETGSTHLFFLKENSKECHSYLDSRASWTDKNLSLYGHPFKDWHTEACQHLGQLTPKVRECLKFKGKPSNTNLLRYRVDMISCTNDSLRIEIEDDKSVWVSGWPTDYAKRELPQKFPGEEFNFIDDLLTPEERTLPPQEKSKLLIDYITEGYYFERYSYLIKEREDYLKGNLERAKQEISYFNQRFLHTEQGLLIYLSSTEFIEKAKKEIEKLLLDKDYKMEELAIVINVASSNSVCLCCADRLFRESEWGNDLLKSLLPEIPKARNINLKLHFLASATQSYPDDLGNPSNPISKNLIERLKKDTESGRKIGFDGTSKINFMNSVEGRQIFNDQLPLIAHTLI